jgi:PTS system ascorbate-specific IIA component
MSIGILIITHASIGSALLETATKMLGICPISVETLSVCNDSNVDLLREHARGMLESMDQGDGVLVLTDMYGSTPSNIACELQSPGSVCVLTGVNLPMLVRLLNYSHLDLKAVVNKALSGGQDGIMICKHST